MMTYQQIFFKALVYATFIHNKVYELWTWYWKDVETAPMITEEDISRPRRAYFLSDTPIEYDDTYSHVPEDAVYIEEWVRGDEKRCVVRYEGEGIPETYDTTPWDVKAKCPWVWVGDKETEIDLTRTFNKFVVAGNRIEVDLVAHLIQFSDRTKLVYIESGTFKEQEFPGDGIVINAAEPV